MKLHISLTATRIDQDAVKGEDFDEELESQLDQVNIEGWEFEDVRIEREKVQTQPPNVLIGQALGGLAAHGREPADQPQLDQPYPSNPTYTWRQMVKYWAEELQRPQKEEPA